MARKTYPGPLFKVGDRVMVIFGNEVYCATVRGLLAQNVEDLSYQHNWRYAIRRDGDMRMLHSYESELFPDRSKEVTK